MTKFKYKLKGTGKSARPYNEYSLLKLVSQGGTYNTIWSMEYNLNTLETSVVIDRGYEKKYIFTLDDHQS